MAYIKIESDQKMSKNDESKLYGKLISAIIEHIFNRNIEAIKKQTEIRYFGDIVNEGKFEIKFSEEGEKYYEYK